MPGGPEPRSADVLLADGTTVHLRAVTPDDADALVALHSRLSERTRYLRYFSPYPRIPPADLDRFVSVDHHDREALAVWIGDQLIAVGRYERLGAGATDAEVAFAVEDAQQGRGIGSVLLEHLAAAARPAGITRFVAEVLPENAVMLRVFAEAGFEMQRRWEEGVVHLTFPIAPTERSREVQWAREQRAEAASIVPLLAPRGVAVYGVRRTATGIGASLRANLRAAGYAGPVVVVHPEPGGRPGTYRSATDAPGPLDLAVVATPPAAVPEVIADAAAAGVRGLVVISAGFAETGDAGAAAERRLVRSARARGMRVVGPSCFGVANTDPAVRLNATLAPQLPTAGRVALFSHSGGFGIALLAEAQRRGVGLASFVAAGNRADVSGNDLLQYWRDDPRTDVILLYLESFGDPRKFARLARAVGRTKPLVAVAPRIRRPAGGGHLLDEQAKRALFAHSGVIRVHTVPELFDVGVLLARQPLPAGRRVGIVTNAPALGGLAAAACPPAGLAVADGNPHDVGPQADADAFAAALDRAAADPATDALVVVVAPPAPPAAGEGFADAVVRAATAGDKPVVATFVGVSLPPEVPAYDSVEEAVQALARVAGYARWRREPAGTVPPLPDADPEAAGVALVTGRPYDVLAAYGIPVSAGSPDGVACVVEVAQDPAFGPVVGFGLAGVATELLGDRAWRVAPLTDRDAAELVAAPRAAPLLAGWRGAAPADLDALSDLLVRVGRLADEQPRLRALTLDPVLARPDGVSVRDAHLEVGEPATRPDTGPRRL